MDCLKGKRLLIIGGVNAMEDLILLAHRNGVTVGVADYNENTYLKSIADQAHNVSATDVDEVVKLVRDEHYDGIISNFVDMLAPFVSRQADELGMYSPFTEEQLLMSTNKKYFKNTCMKYGVQVPKEYTIDSKESIRTADLKYPVIIKPVDGSGSKGVNPCFTEEELLECYDKAITNSRTKDVIVEEYIPFDEINVTYIIQDGDVQCAAIHDRYFNEKQEGCLRVPDLYIYPSRYTDIYMEKFNEPVVNMLKGIGLKNGSLFMQACVRNGEVYFYEAGMRLNGCKTYQILEMENDFNSFERLMNFALTGSMGKKAEFDPKFGHWYATLNVLAKPGEIVAKYSGLEEMFSYPWLIAVARRYHEGDLIPLSALGTLGQDTTRIQIMADTKEQLIERIGKINEIYRIYNPEGENIILAPHDLQEVYEGLDYDL